MKKSIPWLLIVESFILVFIIGSCKKSNSNLADNHFNLDVVLKNVKGTGSYGFIKFRQDSDTSRIITLDTELSGMMPYHEYQLQRAVDTTIDGNCTGTAWLTLGKGLQPQSIVTDGSGKGKEQLWRSVASIAKGSRFDIHFQVIDPLTMAVVLTSDCYQYTVR